MPDIRLIKAGYRSEMWWIRPNICKPVQNGYGLDPSRI